MTKKESGVKENMFGFTAAVVCSFVTFQMPIKLSHCIANGNTRKYFVALHDVILH